MIQFFKYRKKYNIMKEDHSNFEEYRSIVSDFQSIRNVILKSGDLRLISQLRKILQKKIQFQKEFVENHYEVKSFGRGGNNVSENIKKCIFSLLRKIFPQSIYTEIMQNCIKKYKLKSQKELIFFVFLFLLKLARAKQIQYDSILKLLQCMHEKIRKFIHNSRARATEEQEREQFHRKNIEEFNKYLLLNLDFTNNQSIIDLKDQLKGLYLKKIKDFQKAEKNLINFITSEPTLKEIFTDLSKDADSHVQRSEQTV